MTVAAHFPFLSAKAKSRYLELNERRARAWPIACECKTVETAHGRTFMRVSGPVDAPPLVLLPGGGAHSLMWLPNIAGLSERHRTYALDSIVDVGLSANAVDVKSVADLVAWLDGLFEAPRLGPRLRLMGLSHGAWLAANYAQRHPDRLDKLVLLAPAGWITMLSPAMALTMLQLLLYPRRYFIRRAYRSSLPDLVASGAAGLQLIDEMTEDLALAFQCFGVRRLIKMLEPTVVDDDTLRRWCVPTLFVIGEHENIYSCPAALARLEQLAPQIARALVVGAGHDLTWLKPEPVNRVVLEFLAGAALTSDHDVVSTSAAPAR